MGARVEVTAVVNIPVKFGQPAKQGEKYVEVPSAAQTGSNTRRVQLQPTLHSLYKLSVLKETKLLKQ